MWSCWGATRKLRWILLRIIQYRITMTQHLLVIEICRQQGPATQPSTHHGKSWVPVRSANGSTAGLCVEQFAIHGNLPSGVRVTGALSRFSLATSKRESRARTGDWKCDGPTLHLNGSPDTGDEI